MKPIVAFFITVLASTGVASALPRVRVIPASVRSTIVATVPKTSFRDLGRAAPSSVLSVALVLRYHNEAQLDRLVELQSDKGSPLYRHWLSNAQFNATFAPTTTEYTRVIRSMRQASLRVTHVYANRTVVDAIGTVAALDRYFGTEIHRVVQPGYGVRYANVVPGHAPIDLGDMLRSVDGLNTLTLVQPFIERVRGHHAMARLPQAAGPPLHGPVSTVTGLNGYSPYAFEIAYDFPIEHKTAKNGYYDGTGRASAILMDADFADSDLAAYLAYFNIVRTGPPIVRIPIDGGPPSGSGSGSQQNTGVDEMTLDAEATVSTAPGTALYAYEIPALSTQSVSDAYNQIVSDNLVDTVSSSFGGPEGFGGAPAATAWDSLAEQGAAKGITFIASSGDNGGDYVMLPASAPHVIAVGGTSLVVNGSGKWSSETGWGASGGGISQLFALPSWQTGIAGVLNSGRNVPDVALDANPYTGFAMYLQGSWNTDYNPVGGTSLSSPLLGAAITEIDQEQGARMGLAGEASFTLWAKDGYRKGAKALFHDIKLGNNGVYYDVPGYDLVTGIGSVDFWNVAKQL